MSQNFERFGKYILLEKIQTGGMAEIYLARKPGVGGVSKFVAIKRILPQYSNQSDFIEMFKDEAKIAVNLAHANIVTIHEFGMEKNQFFIAMDFVEGRNLRQIINKMKKSGVSFSIEQILFIAKEVAAGLDHAHRSIDSNTGKPLNIIHRDMSPQNVMISFEGETKIVDFGIAKAETQIENTRAGTLKGKFSYMSPEQAEGANVDLRTDIFALGIVLWELLANDRLFVANSEVNTLRKVRDCQIPLLRKVNPNIPPELERIVSKALAKDRNLRYQTSAALERELSRFLNRQYPDFSQHDFSVFIKTLFAAEILENRKKMIEYAKVDSMNLLDSPSEGKAARPVSDSLEQNRELTITENDVLVADPAKMEPQRRPNPAAPQSPLRSPAEREPIITSSLSVDRGGLRDRETGSYLSTPTSAGNTYYGTSSIQLPKESSSSFLPMALVMVGVIAGVLAFLPSEYTQKVTSEFSKRFLLNKDVHSSNSPDTKNGDSPTLATYAIKIDSVPSGAEVLINGETQPDTTPTTVRVQQNIDAVITVRKPGYVPFEQREKIDSNKMLNLKLLAERLGKLDINVVGAGKIYVNGKLVAQGSPANDIAVPADREIVVRAEDPATRAADEIRVVVAENSTKKVTLIPRMPAAVPPPPAKKP